MSESTENQATETAETPVAEVTEAVQPIVADVQTAAASPLSLTLIAEAKHFLRIALTRIEAIPLDVEHDLEAIKAELLKVL